MSQACHVKTEPEFLACADALRATFDANFDDPRAPLADVNRFCWDYW